PTPTVLYLMSKLRQNTNWIKTKKRVNYSTYRCYEVHIKPPPEGVGGGVTLYLITSVSAVINPLFRLDPVGILA
ncbi:MAG: hypothetical protein ACKPJ4_19345, partial [Dolichospermum sp.]